MKRNMPMSVMGLAAAAMLAGPSYSNALEFKNTSAPAKSPDADFFKPKKQLVNEPTRNQRKIRKARRQAWAAGNRAAFA